jgi:hypothetical protein
MLPRVMLRGGAAFLAIFCLLLPASALAQVFVVSPQPGAASSYKRTVISWLPMPGARSYHLQIDDDPAFGSPEVDVVVTKPSYALRGERLRLNGQIFWAAYVRVNGIRWRAPAFTPSYFPRVEWPDLAVDHDGRVHYAYLSKPFGESYAFIRSSTDWSAPRQLSPPDTDGNPHDIAAEVDPFGIVHAFWTEQTGGAIGVPFYTNSLSWTPLRIAVSIGGLGGAFDVGPTLLLTDTAVEIFEEAFGPVQRFTSTDGGLTFAQSTVPDSGHTVSVHGALDPAGEMLLVESRIDRQLYLQTSRDDFGSSHWIGRGRYPTLAVGGDGIAHVVARDEFTGLVSYSNHARNFATWTPLPLAGVIGQQLLPVVADDRGNAVYTAAPFVDGVRLCGAAMPAEDWACGRIGGPEGSHPDLKLDASGVLHVAWSDAIGGGYANSLGSFLAVNLPPEARFAAPVYSPWAVAIDTKVSDGDGDIVGGSVAIGQSFDTRTLLGLDQSLPILGDHLVTNGETLRVANRTLLFRVGGGEWRTFLSRTEVEMFPALVEVITSDFRQIDSLTIEAWTPFGLVVNRRTFIPYVGHAFVGKWLPPLALTLAPFGNLTLRVTVTDGASTRIFDQPFVRWSPSQVLLVP